MRNKRILIGVAVGVAALTAAGILMMRRNKSSHDHLMDEGEHYADSFKSKLHNLQRKAQKEYRNIAADGGELANKAKERANQWVSKGGANL